jgi:quercetin dioxygenase-like cupin family protein
VVKTLAASLLLLSALPAPAAQVPVLKNAKVVVTEYRLMPAESANIAAGHPSAIVYFDGRVEFKPAGSGPLRNTGPAMMRFAEVAFAGNGSDKMWGSAGLAPNYKVVVENRYARVYDIRIPAGGSEPQHTHKARVVICLSGAELKHILPNGKEEPSSLKTGEIAWRPAATHAGVNLGKTNLWVIAVEPK